MGKRAVMVDTLDELVVLLCKDFLRRERMLACPEISHRTKVELKYINYKIVEAAREIVGNDYSTYIKEIGRAIENLSALSERTWTVKRLWTFEEFNERAVQTILRICRFIQDK